MTTWKKWLEEKKALIADGGWGTELFKRGLKPGEVPEGWNIDRPAERPSRGRFLCDGWSRHHPDQYVRR